MMRRLGWLLALTVTACEADGGQTSGARFTLHTRMELEGTTASTRSNWNVQLTRVRVAVGALHYFTGEPLGASRVVRKQSALAEVLRWISIPSAHAHPGHYVEGEALGEMLTPSTIDLLAPVTLGDANATSGTYRSARFTFAAAPSAEQDAEMGGAVLLIEGDAARDAENRRFLFRAAPADLLNASQKPEIEGCHFAEHSIEAEGTVVLTAKPSIWFAAADFSELAEEPNGAAVEVAKDSRLYRQIRERVIAAAGIDFRYEE